MDGEAQEEADEEEYIQPEQYPDLDEEEEHVD